ncbi:MAG: CaiB/BaiF CoA transferase family protein [Solirubrobacterales bacterium]
MSDLPLKGVKVLDLSRLLPGPFCSLLLADLGAEVLKVEDTGAGDYMRWTTPYAGGEAAKASGTHSVQFDALNRNKQSIQLDLKSNDGKEILLKLVADHDVVLESFRPGVLDKLNVGYDQMKTVNPGVIYCAITGYGQDGPFTLRAGHDMNYLGLNGLLGLTGAKGGPPVQAAGQIADIGGGAQMAAIAILAVLVRKNATGIGAEIDISMTDGALSWLAMPAAAALAGDARERGDVDLAGKWVCYMPYEAADGWVSCGALEPKFWQAFARGVGREDLIEKQFELAGSDGWGVIAEVFKTKTRAEWAAFNDEHDCCIEPVLGIDEALESDLVKARGMVTEVDQPGIGPVGQLAPPFVIDGARPDRREPAPGFGEHTDAVLESIGYSAEEIASLRESGAVAGVAGVPTS